MAEPKTKRKGASPKAYVDAIIDEQRRKDCTDLMELMKAVTQEEPKMWGPSIVGFGVRQYKYESGREGEMCLTGFSSRKLDIGVYLTAAFDGREKLMSKLGKHKNDKVCLSIRRLTDVDMKVLEQLVTQSVASVRSRFETVPVAVES